MNNCLVCGHTWESRVERPVACPCCKSYKWAAGVKRTPQKPNKRESGAFGEKVESEAVRQEVQQTAIMHAVGCRCYTCKPPK